MNKPKEANLPTIGYVRLPTILALFPVSAATWWNMVRDGKAPKPVKLGPRITAWKAAEIRKLLGE
jgi:predicted DNA-binding transcriptional regulator AlpA